MASDFVFSQDIICDQRGLINLDNTCYVNAIIQCLFGCQQFRDFFMSGQYMKYIRKDSIYQGHIADAVGYLFSQLSPSFCKEACEPVSFRDAVERFWPLFVKGRQMDAMEFLTFLLDSLHEDLMLRGTNQDLIESEVLHEAVLEWKLGKVSAISQLFNMQIITQLRCSACGNKTFQYDDTNNHISLGLFSDEVKTVEHCLKNFFAEELLPSFKCQNCVSSGVHHRLILGRLPPLLVVHLKRFECGERYLSKIDRMVEYSDSLDLAEHCLKGLQSVTKYKLVGVTEHLGPLLRSGHYTAKSRRRNRWYNFNDTRVTSTTSRHLCSSSGYVLFYEQEQSCTLEKPFDFPSTITLDDFLMFCMQSEQADSVTAINDESDAGFSELILEETIEDELGTGERFEDNNPQPDACSSPDMFAEVDEQHVVEFSMENTTEITASSAFVEDQTKLFDNESPLLYTGIIASDEVDKDHQIMIDDALSQQLSSIQISPCQHPNFDLDLIDPVLTEDDIPGAKLDLDNLKSYKNDQLKWWLACRGLHYSDLNKSELITRILNHKRLAHKINPGVDKGKWYEEKRRKVMAEADEAKKRFPMMPLPFGRGKSMWKSFPSVHIPNNYSTEKAIKYLKALPEVRFSIAEGLVVKETEAKKLDENENVEDDEDDMFDFTLPTQQDRKRLFVDGTIKRANLFIDSGRVLSVEDCQKDKHYLVKAQVQASMINTTYGINVIISQSSGEICMADCGCKARALGRCCHVMAVLFLIGRHIEQQGHAAITCTGRRCYWIAPSGSQVKNPGVIREKHEYYPDRKYYRQGHFDPRPTALQTDKDEEQVKQLFDMVSKAEGKVLWFYHLQRDMQQQQMEEVEEECYPDCAFSEVLADLCSYFMWNLNQIRHYSSSQPLHFPHTKNQSDSKRWIFERAVRVPASSAKKFLGLLSPRSTSSGKINFMRKHVWQLDNFRNNDMIYGTDLEPNARKAYAHDLKLEHPEFDVIQTGIWVNPRYPQLSCSPDGIVVDVNGFVRLLEIKCPAVLAGMDPNNFEELPKTKLQNFCLTRNKGTGKIELRQSNGWYFQIQQSLDILRLEVCDFVVYSEVYDPLTKTKIPKYLKLEIPFDESFWKEKRERLLIAHRELIVPEYFMYKSVFKRSIHPFVYSCYQEDHEDNYFNFFCEPQFTLAVENESEVLINCSSQELI